ncbi:hypothetical protein K7B10_37820 [Streptomyces flavotricini]|uniref:Uncharacterized protein n=1 Tax=Streptomyces flavotricini TaxID=66888 RepID=A0ABS8EI95_9ACTN|nr:hypothetical protein [Streptomyces flavotricini]MCC0100434.1 hypothetical protein [Streptomyces flavotricini]
MVPEPVAETSANTAIDRGPGAAPQRFALLRPDDTVVDMPGSVKAYSPSVADLLSL